MHHLAVALAAASAWTPAPADLVQTPRACPASNPAVSCWSVPEDPTAPLLGSLPSWGQCVYYVSIRRPDVWANRSPADPDPGDWDAWTWVDHARLEGLTVSTVPAPGAIEVMSPEAAGDSSGHVALVESVTVEDGGYNLVLSEMNNTTYDDPDLGQGDTRAARLLPGDPGYQFILEPGETGPPPLPIAAGPLRSQPGVVRQSWRRGRRHFRYKRR